jgi:hypothetical protein
MGWLVGLLSVIASAFWVFEWPHFGDEVLVYTGWCAKKTASERTCEQWTLLDREPDKYLVNVATQAVVMQRGAMQLPVRLEACAVMDARNWSCIRPLVMMEGYNFFESMTHGEFLSFVSDSTLGRPERLPLDSSCEASCPMPRWRWLYLGSFGHVPFR